MAYTATRIRLCGRFEAELDGVRVDGELRGTQGRLLFAYLVLHRDRPVRREELEQALWEAGRPASPGALAPPLSRLRRTVGPERLPGRGELRLLLGDGAWVDVEAVRGALAAARGALDEGDARRALEGAAEAARIAAGGLLPGLEAGWLQAHRARLDDVRIEALEVAAAAGVRLGGRELGVAERAAREAVELAPFRESARVALLEVLRAQGNVAEALRAFEDARTLLREELGAVPGPTLLAAHAELLRLEAHPAAPARPAGLAPASASAGLAPSAAGLIERDAEEARLRELLDALGAGRGGVVVVEGAAGIGKTRLLDVARAAARDGGARVLAARASELEWAFGFGVVRQLFEATVAAAGARERLLAGAAAPAAAVFDAPAPEAATAGDVSFAVLHGLYWLALNLAAEQPLVLVVDDLQWADPPSLRALGYLARRLEDVPVLLAATIRSTTPEADAALVCDIVQGPSVTVVRPGPLTESGVAALVAERLGAVPDPEFSRACRRATGGNPLLLVQLLAALAADGVTPRAGSAAVVAEVGPRAVSRTVLPRVARFGADAGAVARAVAILGDGAQLPLVAALAGLPEAGVAAAVRGLVRAEVLRPEPPLGFVHPLIGEAVYRDLPPGEREIGHAVAAEALRERRAPREQVATQLMRAPTRGLAWVVAGLRDAAAAAVARGAPESAVPLLARAVAEPPEPAERTAVLRDLAVAEERAGDPRAPEHLAAALAELREPDERARTAHLLAQTVMMGGDAVEAVAIARRAREELRGTLDDRRRELLGFELGAVLFGGDDPARFAELERYRRRPVPRDDGARMLAALAALRWAEQDGEAGECAALALEALGPDRLRASPFVSMAAAHVLVLAEHEGTLEVLDGLVADAHRYGSHVQLTGASLFRGFAMLHRGDLDEAESALRDAWALHDRMRASAVPRGYVAGWLCRTLLERGDLEGAERALAGATGVPAHTEGGRIWAEARLALLVAAGRDDEAVDAAARLARHPLAAPNPGANDRRSLHAVALARLGRHGAARVLAAEELALARRWGAPEPVGRALRVIGTLAGERGVGALREAVAVLERSQARLEHAQALAALGRALGRSGDGDGAGRALARAFELAALCGAHPLARGLERELAGLGAAPAGSRAVLTGRERRLLALADEGLDERAIAQALFLTPHEVRLGLARARAKREAHAEMRP